MAASSSLKTVDLEKLVGDVAKLELKVLAAGVDYMQVWIAQAARLSTIASDTLEEMRSDKASLSNTARRLSAFGKQNTEAFATLASRLNTSYYDEIGRFAASLEKTQASGTTTAQEASAKSIPATPRTRVSRAKRAAA